MFPDVQKGGEEAENVSEYGDPAAVYPFGVDPTWHIAENEVSLHIKYIF